uniref:Uncharacterized protein n=1 Tax=Parascaris equorum TaxID=6256 RepID=A0A914RRH3_PAREQ
MVATGEWSVCGTALLPVKVYRAYPSIYCWFCFRRQFAVVFDSSKNFCFIETWEKKDAIDRIREAIKEDVKKVSQQLDEDEEVEGVDMADEEWM